MKEKIFIITESAYFIKTTQYHTHQLTNDVVIHKSTEPLQVNGAALKYPLHLIINKYCKFVTNILYNLKISK